MKDLTEDYPVLRDALRAHLFEYFVEPLDAYGCQEDSAVCEVSAASYDGFVAFTNGGFRVLVHCDLSTVESEGIGNGFESDQLQQYIDSSHKDAASDFVASREDLTEAFEKSDSDDAETWLWNRWNDAETEYDTKRAQYPVDLLGDEPSPFYTTDIGSEREEFYQYESEYMSEGGTFFYECTVLFYERGHRRNVTGADEIFIFSGINTDFEYGRERGLATCFENTYKLDRLTPERLRVIVETCADRITK